MKTVRWQILTATAKNKTATIDFMLNSIVVSLGNFCSNRMYSAQRSETE